MNRVLTKSFTNIALCRSVIKFANYSGQNTRFLTAFQRSREKLRPQVLCLSPLCIRTFSAKRTVTSVSTEDFGSAALDRLITDNTEITRDHLTPELALRLVTERCSLWSCRQGDQVFTDPYWAFYWPGGQALTRYLLERSVCRGRRVVDVGSGCGASALAAAITGATSVLANDIDTVALRAVALNAQLNRVQVLLNSDNLIGQDLSQIRGFAGTDAERGLTPDPSSEQCRFDLVLIGDMFYDEEMTQNIMSWISELSKSECQVLMGEPGRPYFKGDVKRQFRKVAEYEMMSQARKENNGLTTAGVYEYKQL